MGHIHPPVTTGHHRRATAAPPPRHDAACHACSPEPGMVRQNPVTAKGRTRGCIGAAMSGHARLMVSVLMLMLMPNETRSPANAADEGEL